MNAKTTIRKVFFVAIWLCIGGIMVTLLLAAITKKNNGLCKGYEITVEGAKNNLFIGKKDIEQMLFKATNGPINGDPIAAFDLHALEQLLENNNWIDEAEMYFDNKDILHVTISEKEPVARIFTTNGNSFYLNMEGKQMPLSDKVSARVPVFTGYLENKKMTQVDSLILKQVAAIANYIGTDSFWMSQVAQIDITKEGQFEMIPLIGNHLIKLGNGENIEKKLSRLMVFYTQVLSKTGFDRYKVIDVQYKGQVVVSKQENNTKVDLTQLKKNVEKLIKESIEVNRDTVVKIMPAIIKLEKDSATTVDPSLVDAKVVTLEKKTDKPKKEKQQSDKLETKKPELKKPKAIMPTKVSVEEKSGYN